MLYELVQPGSEIDAALGTYSRRSIIRIMGHAHGWAYNRLIGVLFVDLLERRPKGWRAQTASLAMRLQRLRMLAVVAGTAAAAAAAAKEQQARRQAQDVSPNDSTCGDAG